MIFAFGSANRFPRHRRGIIAAALIPSEAHGQDVRLHMHRVVDRHPAYAEPPGEFT
jgi:hypothetical protein